MKKETTISMLLVAVAALSLLLDGVANARRSQKQILAELEAEADKLEKSIDSDVQWLFRYQVETGWYRSRLLALQLKWKELMERSGVRTQVAKKRTYAAPPSKGFRIDDVVGSEQLDLEKAFATPGCKEMRSCRLWLRISFSKNYVTRQARFEVSADFKSPAGRRYAVPTKEFNVKQDVMIVEVPLDRVYLPKGSNSGTVKVFGERTVERRSFSLQISR